MAHSSEHEPKRYNTVSELPFVPKEQPVESDNENKSGETTSIEAMPPQDVIDLFGHVNERDIKILAIRDNDVAENISNARTLIEDITVHADQRYQTQIIKADERIAEIDGSVETELQQIEREVTNEIAALLRRAALAKARATGAAGEEVSTLVEKKTEATTLLRETEKMTLELQTKIDQISAMNDRHVKIRTESQRDIETWGHFYEQLQQDRDAAIKGLQETEELKTANESILDGYDAEERALIKADTDERLKISKDEYNAYVQQESDTFVHTPIGQEPEELAVFEQRIKQKQTELAAAVVPTIELTAIQESLEDVQRKQKNTKQAILKNNDSIGTYNLTILEIQEQIESARARLFKAWSQFEEQISGLDSPGQYVDRNSMLAIEGTTLLNQVVQADYSGLKGTSLNEAHQPIEHFAKLVQQYHGGTGMVDDDFAIKWTHDPIIASVPPSLRFEDDAEKSDILQDERDTEQRHTLFTRRMGEVALLQPVEIAHDIAKKVTKMAKGIKRNGIISTLIPDNKANTKE